MEDELLTSSFALLFGVCPNRIVLGVATMLVDLYFG